MADSKITALTADTSPSTDDLIVTVNDPAGTPANKKVTIANLLKVDGLTGLIKATAGVRSAATEKTDYLAPAAWMVCGRLTTESGVPASTSDRTAQSTIYWTPYNGDTVPLYTGSAWIRLAFSEISLALSGLTSGKNYDVFLYNNAGTLALELSAAWTTDTARADALALQNGLYVKSGTTTRLWVGTIRTTSTTTTEDSDTKRFTWNAYNAVLRRLRKTDSTSHTYNGGYRQWNNAATNQVEFVLGAAGQSVPVAILGEQSALAAVYAIVAAGLDTTAAFTDVFGYVLNTSTAGSDCSAGGASQYLPGLGYHYIAALESSASTGTPSFITFLLTGSVQG
jgi:hypothetical protein